MSVLFQAALGCCRWFSRIRSSLIPLCLRGEPWGGSFPRKICTRYFRERINQSEAIAVNGSLECAIQRVGLIDS